jgi:hypothetical protein
MRATLITLVASLAALLPAPAAAQNPNRTRPADACDFSQVPGVIWWGTERFMSMERLAGYAAPILWYSPDEPSLEEASGAAIRIPEVMEGGGPAADRPVMYFQVEKLLTRGAGGDVVDRTPPGGPAAAVFDVSRTAALTLSFYAYFKWEEGLGAHPHDIEPVEFKLVVLPMASKVLQGYTSGTCGQPGWVILASRTSAKAHGLT